MLIIARKEGQRLKVGDDIWVTVIKLRSGHVQIGVEAPRNTLILREELLDPEEKYHWKGADDGTEGW